MMACFCAVAARADVSVTASVDRNRVAFGESLTFTIAIQGTQSSAQPSVPAVDGLNFSGPSTQTTVSIVNGAMSQSLNLVYQITPTRLGEFTIPAVPVIVASKTYQTEPIKLMVTQGRVQEDLRQSLFAKVRLNSQQVYLGQTAPLTVVLFARANIPLKGVGAFTYEADGLGYRFLQNLKSGVNTINGEAFNIYLIEGAISPTRTGSLAFGPCAVKAQLAVQRHSSGGWPYGDSILDEMMGRVEVREVPVTIDPIPIEVLPLPEEGKPADFTGAVGQWNLEVTAKPTELAVGDPITLTMRISGSGNIDTVATPQLQGLDGFKTYDPTSKTTKDELSTTGERVFQQVLVPKSTEAKQLPQVRLSYFDPVAKAYKTAVQGPIHLAVKAGNGSSTAVLAAVTPVRPQEKLGRDIVYLKGDLGPVATMAWYDSAPTFWALNVLPIFSLLGLIAWKRRTDRLRGDVAYARRTRAAKNARKMLAETNSFDQVQHALQSYLGDLLNIPVSGITASIVDEQLVPLGLNGDLLTALKKCFEACDNARFAGVGNNEAEMRATANKVGELIDALEKIHL
jgi:hypothetical protein